MNDTIRNKTTRAALERKKREKQEKSEKEEHRYGSGHPHFDLDIP